MQSCIMMSKFLVQALDSALCIDDSFFRYHSHNRWICSPDPLQAEQMLHSVSIYM